MDLPNNNTFCVAPWFQIRNQNNGSKKVCCVIDSKTSSSATQSPLQFLNSSDNLELKKNLHNGVKVSACAGCWQDEENGRMSLRQKLNGVITKNATSIEKTWLDSYFRHKNNFDSDELLMADIKIGNTCNYSCVMCVPEDSSMIYNEWKRKPDAFFIRDKLLKDPKYLDKIKHTGYANRDYRQYVESILSNKRLKYLKLLGGEPLLDKHLLTLLRALPEKQKNNLSLYIVTNGSKDLLATKEYLGNFKSIMFTVSLEGIAQVQDYARHGSNWDTVSKNIIKLKNTFPSDVIIHTTLQTTTILGLKELAEWTKQNDLALSLGVCQQPEYLSFSSLPDSVRATVKKSLEQADLNIIQTSIGDEASWPISKIIDIMERTKFSVESYDKFLKYIEWYEDGKNTAKLRDIFPELFIDKYQKAL